MHLISPYVLAAYGLCEKTDIAYDNMTGTYGGCVVPAHAHAPSHIIKELIMMCSCIFVTHNKGRVSWGAWDRQTHKKNYYINSQRNVKTDRQPYKLGNTERDRQPRRCSRRQGEHQADRHPALWLIASEWSFKGQKAARPPLRTPPTRGKEWRIVM